MTKCFHVHPGVTDMGVRVCGLFGYGINNGERPPELDLWLAGMWRDILSLTAEDIAGDACLDGFRRLHANIGKTGKRWLSSPENMLGNALRTGRFPSINPAVDIYNAISCQSRLALGAHDLSCVSGDISLKILDGTETFIPLGASEPDRVQRGEYGYCDGRDNVLCRLEVRQCEVSKVTSATQDCFFIIQGHQWVNGDHLDETVENLTFALNRFCGGRFERA